MPGRDGTGPLGLGAMTGRGLGVCRSENRPAYGRGMGLGRGLYCKRFDSREYPNSSNYLIEEKVALEARLDAINKQLNK